MDLSSLVRPNILRLTSYSSGKSEFSGKACVYLDTNENPFGDNITNRYPDPTQKELVEKIARQKSEQFSCTVLPENIALGNGSDEILDALTRIFCIPKKDAIVFCSPTFGMYRVVADMNDVSHISLPLDDAFDLDVSRILAEAKKAKILFLCSPNNPTGNAMSSKRIEKILREFQGIAVLDEAYIDFCPAKSFLPRLSEFPRLAITQTFSKAWGMAGVRLGMCFSSSEMTSLLFRIKMPYHINVLTAKYVLARLADPSRFLQEQETILLERNRLFRELARFSNVLKIFPSDSNSLLIQFSDSEGVFQYLLSVGIVVRNFSHVPRLNGCLRISIGSPEENTLLLKTLSVFLTKI
ncbi:histidinol-phosphate transaminase [Candidatus Peregrinibacteria bacterium]|nr:MAG: histidinol-phosphate transaminase [Candidatus Peregrinibacteria bacterium]